MSRILGLLLLLSATCFLLPATAQEKAGDVTYKIVKYDGLVDAILKNRGKVLLLDFWADYCAPCKKRFPKLVKFANEHVKDGLVVISVALDPLDDGKTSGVSRPETLENIDKFLKRQKATFTNLVLDEGQDAWQKFHIDVIPSVYIFDRDGKWSLFEAKDLARNADGPEEMVLELLKKK